MFFCAHVVQCKSIQNTALVNFMNKSNLKLMKLLKCKSVHTYPYLGCSRQKMCLRAYTDSEDQDQTGHMRSLIRAFTVR